MTSLIIFAQNKLAWFVIIGLAGLIIPLAMYTHDLMIDTDKAHDNLYNAWSNGIKHETDCKMLNALIEDEKGHWLHSELYPLVQQRLGELKC